MSKNHLETGIEVKAELQRALSTEYEFTDGLLEFSLLVLRRCEASDMANGTNFSFQVSVVMYIRVYNSALAAYELLKSGFAFHGVMICRSLLEDLVNLKYLNATDAEKRAERYIAFRGLKQARAIKHYRRLVGEHGLSEEMKETFESARKRFREKFPDGEWLGDWSGTSLDKKAETVNMLNDYVFVSSQLSSYLHGGPEGVDAGLRGISNGKQQHLIGPRTDKTLEAMITMVGYLLLATGEMVNKFALTDIKEKLAELNTTCTSIFSKYAKPPENIL